MNKSPLKQALLARETLPAYNWNGNDYTASEISNAAEGAGISVDDYIKKHNIKPVKTDDPAVKVETNVGSEPENTVSSSEDGLLDLLYNVSENKSISNIIDDAIDEEPYIINSNARGINDRKSIRNFLEYNL
jgi:hypothetical protein